MTDYKLIGQPKLGQKNEFQFLAMHNSYDEQCSSFII